MRQVPQLQYCKYCKVKTTTAMVLYEHVMGRKHRACLKRIDPSMVPEAQGLQYFLDNYLSDQPILGLEYIVEIQVGDYSYTCQLCGLEADIKQMIGHVMGPFHLKSYMNSHYPALASHIDELPNKSSCVMQLQTSAQKIHCLYGRGNIKEMGKGVEGPSPAKVTKISISDLTCKKSEQLGEKSDPAGKKRSLAGERSNPPSKRRNLPSKGSDQSRRETGTLEPSHIDLGQGCAPSHDAKPVAPSEHPERDGGLRNETWTEMKILPFKDNVQFFDYLRDYQIQNDEDATFVKTIIKNFTVAITTFQKKQAGELQRPPSTSRPAPAHAVRAHEEPHSHCPESVDESVSSFPQCADRSNLELELDEQSDRAELFFSSIKNMEPSEVSKALEKIAATNAEFREIDVPGVVRYLQQTGRLKNL